MGEVGGGKERKWGKGVGERRENGGRRWGKEEEMGEGAGAKERQWRKGWGKGKESGNCMQMHDFLNIFTCIKSHLKS